jgi:steroid 5-alpha reductase family enzyme
MTLPNYTGDFSALSSIALSFLIGFAPSLVLFGATWIVAKKINNWSIVDVVWSYGFALLALPFVFSGTLTATSSYHLYAAMIILWSVRLGTHLGIRVLGHLETEDGRYQKMREKWGADTDRKMGIFYLQQAIALTVLMLPFFGSAVFDQTPVATVHWVGLGIVAIAMLGEAIADAQLAAFKKDPVQRGMVCAKGLWAWSRHPNYFCEWLIWVGFALLSWSPNLFGIPGILCAATMYYLLNYVTGVAMTEAHLVHSKGEAYRNYQQKVPSFWPRPPRK